MVSLFSSFFLVWVLVLLLSATATGQQSLLVDSLTGRLSELPADTAKVAVYAQLTDALQAVDMERAVANGEEGLQLADRLDEPKSLGYMSIALGRAYANSGRIERAHRQFSRADSIFSSIGDAQGRGSALQKLLFAQMKLGDYEAVTATAFELLTLEESLDDAFLRAEANLYVGYAASAAVE